MSDRPKADEQLRESLSPRWLILTFASTLLILIVGGYWFLSAQEQQLRLHAEGELRAIAQLKVAQISAWRNERLGDAAVLTESPFFTENVLNWLDDPSDELSERLLVRFLSLQQHYQYADVLLVDADDRIRLQLNEDVNALPEATLQAIHTALSDGQPTMTDLQQGDARLPVQLDVIAPLFAGAEPDAAPIGVIVLRVDPEQYLYPLIQSWPLLESSAETVLVRRDGDTALYLNDLRHQAGTAFSLHIPLTETKVPSVMAIEGQEGVVMGTDYDGVEVLAALQAIPDTPWFLIAKIDTAEVLAASRTRAALIGALVLGLMVGLSAIATILWQRRRTRYFRRLLQVKTARQEAELRHQVTLMSIGDGIIATDADGRVEVLNPVAEELTGWSLSEARGKPLEEIFNIVNEETRSTVENPVRQVMREGQIVGLANHTVLIARDGNEVPIADSGAPIRDSSGDIIGVVLDFRDQTEARAAEDALRKSEARYHFLFDNMLEGCQIVGFDWHLIYVNAAAIEQSRLAKSALLGKSLMEIYPGMESLSLFDVLHRCMEDRTTEKTDMEFTYSDGMRKWFEFSIQPVPEGLFVLTLDITERKQREAEIDSLAKFPSQNPNPVLRLSADGVILYANPGSQVILDEWQANVGASVPPFLHDLVKQALSTGSSQEVDLEGQTGHIWAFTVAPIVDDGYVNLYGRDVTERRKAEQELRRANRAFRTLSDGNQALVRAETETDLLRRVCEAVVGAGGYRFVWVGYVEHDEAKTVRPIAHAGLEEGYLDSISVTWADAERGRGPTGRAIRSGKPVAVRHIHTDPDFAPWRADALKRGYASAIALPLLIDGQVIGAMNIYAAEPDAFAEQEVDLLKEMTNDLAYGIAALRVREQHKDAQQALAQERNLLRTLIDILPDFIYAKDTEGRFLVKNQADIHVMGAHSLDEVVGKTDFDYYPEELAERFHADDEQIIHSGQPLINKEEPNVDPNGNTRWMLTTKVPLRDAGGTVIGLVGIGRDITERKRSEEAIRTLNEELERRVAERTSQLSRTKERVEAILNSSTDVIIFCRTNGTIDRANPVFVEVFGYEGEEALFQPLTKLVSQEHVPVIEQAFKAVLDKLESQRLEITVRRRDGVAFDADVTLSPVVSQIARLLGVVCIIRDISDRKRMESELRAALEAERELNALKSRFVSMISHDIRTPLSVIGSSADILRKYSERLDTDQRERHLIKIRSQVERMVDLLNDVLTISRADAGAIPLNRAPLDLDRYCCDLMEEFQSNPDISHTLLYESPGEPVIMIADEKLLYQAITNLITNAIKYSPENSTIRLQLTAEPDRVVLRVSDQGIGIPEEDQPYLFETFHRAANVGTIEGSGLGLAIVKRSIEAHGGTVTCESELGIGTTFTITIPKAS
ncbi:MAG: PAS domain S-box protein [Anaerolineae bacterium]|nr:PAS domain S-box protein [Anaerolineae bacterium]